MKLAKGIAKFTVKNGGKIVLTPLFAYWAYNEARANGATVDQAIGLAGYDAIAPPGLSPEDVKAYGDRYVSAVEGAAELGRGIGDPSRFEGTLLGPGFVEGRRQRESYYREFHVDGDNANIYGNPKSKY